MVKMRCAKLGCGNEFTLSSLSADSTSKLDILGHDGNSFGVDRTQVRIFKKSNEVRFCSFLESQNSSRLKTQIGLEVLGNFADKTLEWSLADQQISRLLILANFTESDSSWSVAMGLLDTSSGRSRFAGGLFTVNSHKETEK